MKKTTQTPTRKTSAPLATPAVPDKQWNGGFDDDIVIAFTIPKGTRLHRDLIILDLVCDRATFSEAVEALVDEALDHATRPGPDGDFGMIECYGKTVAAHVARKHRETGKTKARAEALKKRAKTDPEAKLALALLAANPPTAKATRKGRK